MKSKVYYGEYTLQHWIDLIIKKNIQLPSYQRHFVWDKQKVKNLIEAISKDQFVPPVTIGLFKVNGKNVNYILDGQQRITSLLLASLSVFPKKDSEILRWHFSENDEELEQDEDIKSIIDWSFSEIVKLGDNFAEIKRNLQKTLYENFDLRVSTSFFYKKYLGFSYIVPNCDDSKEQQKYYSSVFRNINQGGVNLLEVESRKSLYFLDNDLVDFFEPEFINKRKLKNFSISFSLDFVRYMALLSQYKKDGNEGNIARGFKSRMEDFYEEYIYSVVGESSSSRFVDFTSIFPNKDYHAKMSSLQSFFDKLLYPHTYTSIIELDIYSFGLIYLVIFLGKRIDLDRKAQLFADLNQQIEQYRKDERHKKSPASLKYLRARIKDSVNIYMQYGK